MPNENLGRHLLLRTDSLDFIYYPILVCLRIQSSTPHSLFLSLLPTWLPHEGVARKMTRTETRNKVTQIHATQNAV